MINAVRIYYNSENNQYHYLDTKEYDYIPPSGSILSIEKKYYIISNILFIDEYINDIDLYDESKILIAMLLTIPSESNEYRGFSLSNIDNFIIKKEEMYSDIKKIKRKNKIKTLLNKNI
jgi:hypothetical protein